LSGIQTKGKFTVESYDGNIDPVGKTVSGVAGLGWELAATPVVNAANAAAATAPYINTTGVSLAIDAGVGKAYAANLLTNLVLMPQTLATNSGPKITISYTITTGTGDAVQTTTYADKEFYFGQFDSSDPDPSDKDNTDPRVSAWMPGVHYVYYITINANAITFSASIANWADPAVSAHYYLVN
jgi:hypothetical protein